MRLRFRPLVSVTVTLLAICTASSSLTSQAAVTGRSIGSGDAEKSSALERSLGDRTAPSAIRPSRGERLPGMRCNSRRTPFKCNVYAKYRAWLAYLKWVGKPNPRAKWTKRERRFLRHHPGVDRRIGSTGIFRHPGKRGFKHKVRTRRDHRHKGIPSEAFSKGGGPNYCTTLTLKKLIESSLFKSDLFTAYHKTRWCWDDNIVYDYNEGNWTEIAVHDRIAVSNRGEIASHNSELPTAGTWYSSQQWDICNCAFHIGDVGHWQPLWQVWAKPGGRYKWSAHW